MTTLPGRQAAVFRTISLVSAFQRKDGRGNLALSQGATVSVPCSPASQVLLQATKVDTPIITQLVTALVSI